MFVLYLLNFGCKNTPYTNDVAFQHHSSAFNYYGPLMQMYDNCIRYGDGKTREVVEMESEVVCPMKTYFSGNTTVKMCQRIMGSIDLLKSCLQPTRARKVLMCITLLVIENRVPYQIN